MNFENYSKRNIQFYDNEVPVVLRRYLLNYRPETILECGCGDGRILSPLISLGIDKVSKIHAIDLSAEHIKLVKDISDNISANVDNAEELRTVDTNSQDFIISTQVIEHVDDKKMTFQLDRVLCAGGIIYLTTVFKKRYGWYFYRNNGRWVLDQTHLREYDSDDQLLKLFPALAYKVLENIKIPQKYPLIDPVIKKLGIKDRRFFENKFFAWLRKLKLPIPGYYNWELIIKKR